MLKRSDALYLAGTRTYNWLGLKHGFFDSDISDSFDLVVVGVLPGRGKRGSIFGSFLLASLSKSQSLDLVTKCGQGTSLESL